jgi:hypothetical protein
MLFTVTVIEEKCIIQRWMAYVANANVLHSPSILSTLNLAGGELCPVRLLNKRVTRLRDANKMKSKKLMYALFGMSALAASHMANASFALTSTYFPPVNVSGNFMFSPDSLFSNANFGSSSSFSLLLAGSTPGAALIGAPITGGRGWSFNTPNTGNTIFFDPAVAVGYFYDSHDVAISGVEVGFAYGDDLYDLSVWNGSGALNDVASYTSVLPNWNGDLHPFNLTDNITKILISGIETSAARPDQSECFCNRVQVQSSGGTN